MYTVPVLLIIFNRPETTRQVLSAIRQVCPRYLFVAADGPRTDRPGELQKCRESRKVIEEIDWECEVKTLFRDENRGCGRGPAEAISWFFEQVEQGIILEDDCLPDPSFFGYCEELLDTYRNDESVYMISGTNPLKKWKPQRASYHYSYLGNSLGWATWRRAWRTFDYAMTTWGSLDVRRRIAETLANERYYRHFEQEFEKIYRQSPTDVWDFQWLYARWAHGGKTIVPSVNLITNIGFNEEATHSTNTQDLMANLPRYSLQHPLAAPTQMHDSFYDWLLFERFIDTTPRSVWKRIILKVVKVYTRTN